MADKTQNNNNLKTKRLHLSDKDKKLLGVCGGIAEYLGIDSTVVRLGWLVLTVLTGVVPGTIAYLIAAIVIPKNTK